MIFSVRTARYRLEHFMKNWAKLI